MTIEVELPVDVQVLDHDHDTVWNTGLKTKEGVATNGWRWCFTTLKAAECGRDYCLRKWGSDIFNKLDPYESTIWAEVDEIRASADTESSCWTKPCKRLGGIRFED